VRIGKSDWNNERVLVNWQDCRTDVRINKMKGMSAKRQGGAMGQEAFSNVFLTRCCCKKTWCIVGDAKSLFENALLPERFIF